MDRNSNYKFGLEFSHYLDSFLYSLQCQAGITRSLQGSVTNTGASDDLSLEEILKRKMKASKSSFKSVKSSKDFRSSMQSLAQDILTFNEMRNILDLICLYEEINLKVINNAQSKSKKFIAFTHTLSEIIRNLKSIEVDLSDKEKELIDKYGDGVRTSD
jgi:hypothetical protein